MDFFLFFPWLYILLTTVALSFELHFLIKFQFDAISRWEVRSWISLPDYSTVGIENGSSPQGRHLLAWKSLVLPKLIKNLTKLFIENVKYRYETNYMLEVYAILNLGFLSSEYNFICTCIVSTLVTT